MEVEGGWRVREGGEWCGGGLLTVATDVGMVIVNKFVLCFRTLILLP